LDVGVVKRFRGELVFQAHRLCVSLNSRLESNKEGEKQGGGASDGSRFQVCDFGFLIADFGIRDSGLPGGLGFHGQAFEVLRFHVSGSGLEVPGIRVSDFGHVTA